MYYTKKKLEDMDVMDDFLMEQLAGDESFGMDFCRLIISTLLQKKVGKLRVATQKALPALTLSRRGIRMDVEIEELGEEAGDEPAIMNIYDMEPHLQKDTDIPRHNRFYQAKIDSRGMKRGDQDFSRLPNLYVLMILNFDPFGKERMVYTVRNRCEEEPELEYEDGLKFYYFYTGGTCGGNDTLRALLTYMQDSRTENVTDQITTQLHDYVNRAKMLPEVKQAYMRWEESIYYERKDERISTMIENIQDLLEDYGTLPECLNVRLHETRDIKLLKQWHKLAAKVNCIEEFESGIQGNIMMAE